MSTNESEINEKEIITENTELDEKVNTNVKFEIKKWNCVALWSWDLAVDNCAICRNHIMDLCIECQAGDVKVDTNSCGVSWGVCNHAFHKHCISRWLRTRRVCPLDNTNWEYSTQQ